jgi:hypothetical protein
MLNSNSVINARPNAVANASPNTASNASPNAASYTYFDNRGGAAITSVVATVNSPGHNMNNPSMGNSIVAILNANSNTDGYTINSSPATAASPGMGSNGADGTPIVITNNSNSPSGHMTIPVPPGKKTIIWLL